MLTRQIRSSYFVIVALLLSGISIVLVILRQSTYGVGLAPDPLAYISIAENLATGESLVAWNDSDGQTAPLIFPFILSIVISIGNIDGVAAATYVNMIAYGLLVLVLTVWLQYRIKSRIIIVYVGLACALAPVLGEIHAIAASEPLFILFTVCSLFSYDKFLENRNQLWLMHSALFAALSCLTRYIGIALMISTIALIIGTMDKLTLSKRVRYAVTYSATAMPLIGVYLLRNYLEFGRLTEPVVPSEFFSLYKSIDIASSEFIRWISGDIGFDTLENLSSNFAINNVSVRIVTLSVLSSIIILGFKCICGRKTSLNFGSTTTVIAFAITYTFVLIVSLLLTDISLTSRYMIPLYVPGLVIVAVVLDQLLSTEPSKLKVIAMASLMCLWLVLTINASYTQIKIFRDHGFGYLSKPWIESETIGYLSVNPVSGQIYSNNIRAVYASMLVLRHANVHYNELPSNLPEEAYLWAESARAQNLDMYVIWFHGWKQWISHDYHDYDFMQLKELLNLEIVSILEDGIVLKANNDPMAITYPPGDPDNDSTLVSAILQGSELIASSTFDIYSDGSRLIYVSMLCHEAELKNPFFMHIFPTDPADISKDRKTLNFNNYDFQFNREGFSFGERCAVIRNLPAYDIELIKTGQFISGGTVLWEASIQP